MGRRDKNIPQHFSAHLNKSLICVPMSSPGVHLAKRIDKMGMRSSDTAVIYFDEVRVPAANIIGEPGNNDLKDVIFKHLINLYDRLRAFKNHGAEFSWGARVGSSFNRTKFK